MLQQGNMHCCQSVILNVILIIDKPNFDNHSVITNVSYPGYVTWKDKQTYIRPMASNGAHNPI